MAIYINGIFCKQGKFSIKLSGNAEKICAEIMANANEKGNINLEIKERKEPDKNGNTHYIVVDEWKPTPQAAPNQAPQQPDSFMEDESNSLPF